MNGRLKIALFLGIFVIANTGCVTLATNRPHPAARGKRCAPGWAAAIDLGVSVGGIVSGVALWASAPPSNDPYINLPSGPRSLVGGLIVLAGVSYLIGSGITVALVDICDKSSVEEATR